MRFKVSYLFLYMAFSLKSDMYILTNDLVQKLIKSLYHLVLHKKKYIS